MTAWIARARLRRDAPARALAPLLLPSRPGEREGAAHRLLWTLFGADPDATRDFLWREQDGRFVILSAREPVDAHDLFELDHKPYAPALAAGMRLRFALRANPVVQRQVAGHAPKARARRHDVVMDALSALPREERNAARDEAATRAGRAWLERLGARHGFTVGACAALGYDRISLPRRGGAPAILGVLDLEGELEVTDPAALLAQLPQGFGRGRAFGCGLLLLRRA